MHVYIAPLLLGDPTATDTNKPQLKVSSRL